MFDLLVLLSIVSASLATILNVILLPIIAFKSASRIGSYKVLLFLNTLAAALYSSSHAIVIPSYYVENGRFILFSKNTLLNTTFSSIAVFVFGLCFVFILVLLSVSFIYRLSMLTNTPNVSWFHEPKKVTVVVFLSIVICIVAETTIVIAICPSENTTSTFAEGFKKQTGLDMHNVGYLGGLVRDQGTFISLCLFGILCLIGVGIICYCSIKLVQGFRKNLKNLAAASGCVKYQRKLFFLLCLQAVLPFVFTLSPPMIAFACALFDFNAVRFVNHAPSVMSMSTLLDPLLVVYFISDYRKVFLRVFGCGSEILPHSSNALRVGLQSTTRPKTTQIEPLPN